MLIDVDDAINGYILALNSHRWGEVFCFGNDKPVKMQKVLDILVGLSSKKTKTEVDPERLRPIDVKTMKCDSSKAKDILGWKQKVPLEKSMQNLLDYWRERIR